MIEVTEKQNCCGCTACVAVCPKNCIEMKEEVFCIQKLIKAVASTVMRVTEYVRF